MLEPGGERLAVQRVFAVPRILGPGLEGVEADEEACVLAADDRRVKRPRADVGGGRRRSVANQFGGLATHQARRAAAAIARLAGADDVRDPGEPVLHGRLLVGHRTRNCPDAVTPRGRHCGGPPGRSRASTCPAGSPSTASPRPPRQNRRKAASPSGGRCGRWRPKPFTCTSSHASSAAPTRPSARSDAGCVRRASADRPAARAPEPASRSRDSQVDDPRDLQGRESAVTQLLRDTAATQVMGNVRLEAGARALPGAAARCSTTSTSLPGPVHHLIRDASDPAGELPASPSHGLGNREPEPLGQVRLDGEVRGP